jgi:hypothetical protein
LQHPLAVETYDRGIQVAQRYRLPIYDSMIVSSALLVCGLQVPGDSSHQGLAVRGKMIPTPGDVAIRTDYCRRSLIKSGNIRVVDVDEGHRDTALTCGV